MAHHKVDVGDLAVLAELTEQTILDELHSRYRRDIIYTNIGDILVAINPYKELAIYGSEIGDRYSHVEVTPSLPPHVYTVATRCSCNLWYNGLQQCVLVSGESGAGKTESTKMLISQIVRCSKGHMNKRLEEQIVEVNPLLEAFGNAETAMNSNSSRFGKLIEIIFSSTGSIIGAQITEHMLEKCRVVGQAVQEKNFHIFYYLFAGLTPHELERYFLGRPEMYRIIDPRHALPVFSDVVQFRTAKSVFDGLRQTFAIVGFSSQDMDLIFAMLAAILHLTNVEFVEDPDTESVIIINEDEVDFASVLLSVQPEDMVSVLLSNTAFVRGERIVSLKTLQQACDGRDALAKSLYSRLFSWIIQQINLLLNSSYNKDRHQLLPSISVLDMAGFENFSMNSFEQLCINVANEQFQSYFNNHIFYLELDEYEREGIKQPKIKFTDNQKVLDLFLQRANGLFAVLDDECRLSKTTDMTLVDKMNQMFIHSENYKKSRHREPLFSIIHYAGLVTYNAIGFLDKNRDTLSTNLTSLMENSHNKLVTELFTAKVTDTGTLDLRNRDKGENGWTIPEWKKPNRPDLGPEETLSRRAGRKLREKMKSGRGGQGDAYLGTGANTASGCFRNSLLQLITKLSSAEPHFIRCIRPNTHKTANSFDSKLVLKQLYSTGVIETTRIRRLGYSTRLKFQDFLDSYKFLVYPLTAAVYPRPESCKRILDICGLREYKIGKSKVFLKYWHTEQLSGLLSRQSQHIITVQRVIRGFIARQKFRREQEISLWHYRQLEELSFLVTKQGDRIFNAMLHQCDYDKERYQKMMADRAREQEQKNRSKRQQLHPYSLDDQLPVPDYEEDHSHKLAQTSAQFPVPDYDENQSHKPESKSATVQPFSHNGQRYSPSQSPTVSMQRRHQEADFYEIALNQVREKWSEIDPDIWCKIFYLEYNQQLGKMYIIEREITVDGTHETFDGKRIGIGAFSNPERSERVNKIRNYIGKGLTLKQDAQGSIHATREGRNDIIVKGHDDPANHCLSAQVVQMSGLLPFQKTVKIFDMEELKSHIGIEMRKPVVDKHRLERLCIVSLSFIKDAPLDLNTPCWLCIVNLKALSALDGDDLRKQVQQKVTELSLRDMEKEKAKDDLKQKYDRPLWSKLHSRQSIQGKDEPLRKTRQELRKAGGKVEGHMDYSWQGSGEKSDHLNMAELEDEYDYKEDNISPHGSLRNSRSGSANSSNPSTTNVRRDWAKVKAAIKTADQREGELIRKAKADLRVQ